LVSWWLQPNSLQKPLQVHSSPLTTSTSARFPEKSLPLAQCLPDESTCKFLLCLAQLLWRLEV
jgi:hypothetical protein